MIRYSKSFILTLVLSFSVCVYGEIHLSHTQDRSTLRHEIIETLQSAQESILILTFTLSDPEILQILNEKADSGVSVSVIIDKDHLLPAFQYLGSKSEIVTRQTGEGRVHHKILVVDRKVTWIGSANFTSSAFNAQENLMIKLQSEELAAQIHLEADVFRQKASRQASPPFQTLIEGQTVHFALLPHDGFPRKKVEGYINDSAKQKLIAQMDNAQNSIQVAMMVWTDLDLIRAALRAHQRGVQVEVVAEDLGGELPQLIRAEIHVIDNPKLGLMHNKFMIVDQSSFVNGSANWSKSSFSRNDESFLIIENLTSTQQEVLQSYWNYLKTQ